MAPRGWSFADTAIEQAVVSFRKIERPRDAPATPRKAWPQSAIVADSLRVLAFEIELT
jgi:hypothetical protein